MRNLRLLGTLGQGVVNGLVCHSPRCEGAAFVDGPKQGTRFSATNGQPISKGTAPAALHLGHALFIAFAVPHCEAAGFGVIIAVCVNKADINPEITDRIKAYCQREGLLFAGAIPYDPLAVQAVNQGRTIVDLDCPSGRAAKEIYRKIMPLLESV